VTGDPPEDDAPRDLDEALERLALDAEGLPRRPRPSAKTLVPWSAGAGRPPGPLAPRQPDASPPATPEEATMVGAPPPEAAPPHLRPVRHPLRAALADTDPSAPRAAPPGLDDAVPRGTAPTGLDETVPRATWPAGLDDTAPQAAPTDLGAAVPRATSPAGLDDAEPRDSSPGLDETAPRAAPSGLGAAVPRVTSPAGLDDAEPRATSPAGLDDADPRATSPGTRLDDAAPPLDAHPAPPDEAPHRPISMVWSELVPGQPAAAAPPGPDPHASLPPVAEAPFAIEVVGGPSAGLVVGVGRRSAMVGRVMGALRVDDPFVSDGHASFVVRLGQLVLVDGGGPSGVYVSARPVEVLQPGQYFAVGLQVFRFLGPVEGPGTPGAFGAPVPRGAYRLEHVLVGDRPGRVVLFGHSASIGRLRGTLQFPEDPNLEALHAELRPGRLGMELLTHGRQAPAFLRTPAGGDVPLQNGDLVRFGASTVRVVAR
jgi:hypothetical protein